MGNLFIIGAAILLDCLLAQAQDPFEIHIYQYEKLEPGRFTLEQHLNYVAIGTKAFAGTVAPSNDQFHMTYELTGGIADGISLGFMALSGEWPGGSGLTYAGWRILPHFYAPESWHLPINLGIVAEFSFQRTLFEENSRRVELRPIIEKNVRHWQLTANPVFERALHGPGVREGWGFEPAGRIGYQRYQRFAPSLEYYGALGPTRNILPVREQLQQFYAGGDLKLRENLLWNVGVGVGTTSAGNRLVFKSRFEFEFGFR